MATASRPPVRSARGCRKALPSGTEVRRGAFATPTGTRELPYELIEGQGENGAPGREYNFQMYAQSGDDGRNAGPYELGSIMHYGLCACTGGRVLASFNAHWCEALPDYP